MRENFVSLTKSLRCYAHALLGRLADQDADDLAQEALLGFLREGLLGRNPPSRALRLSLLRCMTGLSREFLRPQHFFASGEAEDFGFSGDATPQHGAESSRFRRTHFSGSPEARALARLPFESRALLALAALERLDYDEIGAVLDMSAQQALAKLIRARAQLLGETTGVREPHLRAAGRVCDADLHGYADDLLESGRRAEIAALLQQDAEAARRVHALRRGGERLRAAFATLKDEPLPATLNFDPPAPVRPRPLTRRLGLLAWLTGGARPPVHAR